MSTCNGRVDILIVVAGPEGEVDVVGGLDGTRVAPDSDLGLQGVHLRLLIH